MQWNTTKKYDLKKCSATAFVEELLKAVGSKTVISPRIKDVLADAQTKGGNSQFGGFFFSFFCLFF